MPQKHLLLLLGYSRRERQPLFIQFKLILVWVLNWGLPGEQFSSWSWLPLLLFLLFVRRQYVLLLFDIQLLLIRFWGLRPIQLNFDRRLLFIVKRLLSLEHLHKWLWLDSLLRLNLVFLLNDIYLSATRPLLYWLLRGASQQIWGVMLLHAFLSIDLVYLSWAFDL